MKSQDINYMIKNTILRFMIHSLIVILFIAVDELDQYLDPCFGPPSSHLPEGALTDLLLSQEDYWQEQHQRLQQMCQMKPVLDSKPIAGEGFVPQTLFFFLGGGGGGGSAKKWVWELGW